MAGQATINLGMLHFFWLSQLISCSSTIDILHGIGTIGHVAHGKSTVVKAISGVMTVRFKNELVRNITIKLGYANAKALTSHPLVSRCLPDRRARSTSAKIPLAPDQGVTDPIVLTRKITLRVNVQDAGLG